MSVNRVRIVDPSHELYGRVAFIVEESEWYIHVRPLYHSVIFIMTHEQCKRMQDDT